VTDAQLTRVEAAALDMCLQPLISQRDWNTFKAQAADISAGARTNLSPQEVKALLARLKKRKYLTHRKDEFDVTDAGRAALMEAVGLSQSSAAQHAQLPTGLLDEIAAWLDKWLGDRLVQLLRNSAVPFPMPRRKAGAIPTRAMVEAWNDLERAWKLLAVIQEGCGADWWVGRDSERQSAIFEMNMILDHADVLISWEMGQLRPRGAADVDHERLAVEAAKKANYEAAEGRLETVPHVPLPMPDEIQWRAHEDVFRDTFVVPLLRARGLRGVDVRHGTREFGKDIVGWYEPPLAYKRWVAVQVKREIRGGARTGDIQEVQQQILEAFRVPIPDLAGRSHEVVSEVWIVVASPLTAKVRDFVVAGLDDPTRRANIRFFDKAGLEDLHLQALGRK